MSSANSKSLFRKEALDEFSSGELLDRNLVVIKSRSWILLAVLVVVMATGAAMAMLRSPSLAAERRRVRGAQW